MKAPFLFCPDYAYDVVNYKYQLVLATAIHLFRDNISSFCSRKLPKLKTASRTEYTETRHDTCYGGHIRRRNKLNGLKEEGGMGETESNIKSSSHLVHSK